MSDTKNSAMGVDKTSFAFGFVAGVAIVAISVLVIGGGEGRVAGDFQENAYNNQPAAAQPSGQPAQPQAQAASVRPIQEGEPLRGNPEASIDIIEYSDFECPFCLRHVDTMNQIVTEYGDQVRLAYRHFPLLSIHSEAQKAAEASECAEEQGKFWEMHDKIFEAAAVKTMSVTTWKQYADDMGLDTGQFNECLDSGKYAQTVTDELAEGQAAGVQGTPATFINGQMISGAVPFEQIKRVIDAQLQ
jgi:protein-disulfide isomerase